MTGRWDHELNEEVESDEKGKNKKIKYKKEKKSSSLSTTNYSYNVDDELFVENVHYISFKKDLSDFYEKLEYIKSDSENIVNIKKNSYNLVMENHTYDNRAQSLIEWCREIWIQ